MLDTAMHWTFIINRIIATETSRDIQWIVVYLMDSAIPMSVWITIGWREQSFQSTITIVEKAIKEDKRLSTWSYERAIEISNVP